MYYERPLSACDIKAVAEYLMDGEEDLFIAVSELGFDPYLYGEYDLRAWLEKEAGIVQCQDTGVWHRIKS